MVYSTTLSQKWSVEAKSQTILDVYSSERHPRALFPRLLENRDDKKPQRPDRAAVRRQKKLWRKITQDSSSRVRNLKHPATQCTASSRAPGEGGRDGCQSPRCFVTPLLLSAHKAATDTTRICRLTPLAVGPGYTPRAPV